jgi:lysophospholipid acyltransferase (LPLAT)-like uncharacterized protein
MKRFLKKFLRSNWGQDILSFIGYSYIQLVYRTSSWKYINKNVIETYISSGKPFIICFWHGRLMMLPLGWQWSQPFKILISTHRDGALITKVLKYFSIGCIEGSTTRGGTKASLQIIQSFKEGTIIGITPDGPKGPVCTVSAGTVSLAKWVQADLIPVSYATQRRRILKTWDKFHFSLPFTKGVFVVGSPVPYPQEDESFNKTAKELKKNLEQATYDADIYVQAKG